MRVVPVPFDARADFPEGSSHYANALIDWASVKICTLRLCSVCFVVWGVGVVIVKLRLWTFTITLKLKDIFTNGWRSSFLWWNGTNKTKSYERDLAKAPDIGFYLAIYSVRCLDRINNFDQISDLSAHTLTFIFSSSHKHWAHEDGQGKVQEALPNS